MYKYEDPLDRGFRKFRITKKQHNKLFKYRQIKWRDRYEYYYDDNFILLYNFTNWKAIVLFTLLFPVVLLLEGLWGVTEHYEQLYNQKKYRTFSADSIPSGTELYDEIKRGMIM